MRSGARDKRRDDWRAKRAAVKVEPMGYAEMKAHFTMLVAQQVRHLGRPPIAGPVDVTFRWYEANRKRDPDGVRAASKFVLDGLVAAGVLVRDGVAEIRRFADTFDYCGMQGLRVVMEDDGGERWVYDISARFPDFNEILAARGRDGALTERTRQARRGVR